MEPQNYANHRRYVNGYHFLLSLLILIGIIGACVNVYRHIAFSSLLSCLLILWLFICTGLIFWYMRRFPIKAQDRAIRAEERLRYFILTGKPMNNLLTVHQIAALRFASDEEFLVLTDKAIAENMSANEIKKAINNWRSDHHRV